MVNKKMILTTAQVVCFALFAVMALSSGSSNSAANTTKAIAQAGIVSAGIKTPATSIFRNATPGTNTPTGGLNGGVIVNPR